MVLGGDKRFIHLAEHLSAEYLKSPDLNLLKTCDILILPLPVTSGDSTILNCEEKTDLKDIFPLLKKDAVVLAGKVPPCVYNLAQTLGILVTDYYTDEFEVLNAVPSAEGALKIALERTPFTICGSNCLVLGYGRIGKILCKMLSGIGADVTASARRPEVLAMIKSLGFKAQSIYDLSRSLKSADIIFNTVPSLVLDRQNLLNVKKEALIIDLASKPGGCDFESAKELGIDTIHALGLPGIIAPKTSSEILTDCICSLIERRTNGI